MKLHQPHDKLFKETFGDLEVAGNFLKNYLPSALLEEIDTTKLKRLNDSFIEEKLQDSQSDLLYEVSFDGKKGYVYFLFEHKSAPSPDIALQLLGYMLEIWKRELNKVKADGLPVIVPLVFYHGREPWKDLKQVQDWIANYDDLADELKYFVPDFDLLLYDFSYPNRFKAKGDPKLKAYLQLVQHIFLKDWEEIIQTFIKIEALLLNQGHGRYFDTITLYILGSRDGVPIEEIKRRLSEEGRKRFMSTADQLMREGEMRGKAEGMAEGKAKGKAEGKKEVVKNALQLGMDKEEIVKLTGLSMDEIEEIETKS